MQESTATIANIHFPQRNDVIQKLRYISFVINDIVLLVSFIVIVAWVIKIPGISFFLFQTLHVYPFSAILFILCGTSLLFGAKQHLMTTNKDTQDNKIPFWETAIPLFLAITTAVLGLMNFVGVTTSGVLSIFHISSFGGFCFFLMGLALIPPFTRIIHRFHITQFLLFIVSGVNVFVILEALYQVFSPLPTQQVFSVSFPAGSFFVLFSFGALLRWANRGFIGNFTLDSTGSIFALRLFLINLLSAPVIAGIVLALMQKTPYNMYQVLSVIVVLFAAISSLLLWVNIKLLYKYELEHLLMRESLRSHNIDLTTEKEALEKTMSALEQEKEKYAEKLTVQDAWRNIADTSN